MSRHHYYSHIGDLPARLKRRLGLEAVRGLHRVDTRRHLLIAGRHLLLYVACAILLYRIENPWIWVPLAALQGVNILGFVILLHEQVHNLITPGARRRPWERLLGLLYALPSGISASQFDRWHNDHHRELGSAEDDPKRAHLSPKRNSRLLKLLYVTPALFLIYARAAAREARRYEPSLRRRIRVERFAAVAIHLAWTAWLWNQGWEVALRVHLLPLLVFFPPAFTINRLGQHYDVDPTNPAAWSSRVDGNPTIRFLFLSSNHHIEHHYYPGVPLYRLAELNRRLRPFFEEEGIRDRGYGSLVWDWFVRNRAPHTDWRDAAPKRAA